MDSTLPQWQSYVYCPEVPVSCHRVTVMVPVSTSVCKWLFITSSAWTAGDNDGSGTHTPPSPRSARSSRSLRGQSPGRPAQLPPSFLAGQVPRAFREPEGSPTSSYSSAHLAAMPAALQVM